MGKSYLSLWSNKNCNRNRTLEVRYLQTAISISLVLCFSGVVLVFGCFFLFVYFLREEEGWAFGVVISCA